MTPRENTLLTIFARTHQPAVQGINDRTPASYPDADSPRPTMNWREDGAADARSRATALEITRSLGIHGTSS